MAKSSKEMKKLYGANVTGNQLEWLKGMGRTGVCARDDVGKGRAHHVSKYWRDKLEEAGLIKSEYVWTNSYKTRTQIFKLTEKSQQLLREEHSFKYFYRSNIDQIDHDLKLSKVYNQLHKTGGSEVTNTWKVDTQLMRENTTVHKRAKHGMIDATYQVGDRVIGIEVRGKSYSDEKMEEKVETGHNIGCVDVLEFDGF